MLAHFRAYEESLHDKIHTNLKTVSGFYHTYSPMSNESSSHVLTAIF